MKKTESIPQVKKWHFIVLDRAYRWYSKLNFIEEPGIFGPEKIKNYPNVGKIPVNFMFIGAPASDFHTPKSGQTWGKCD